MPFELPPSKDRRERPGAALSVLYVTSTEGSTATTGDHPLRPDLAYETLRPARMPTAPPTAEPEACAPLALLELGPARFPARTGPHGEAALLEDQDRHRRDRSAIRRGPAALGRPTATGRGPGPYGLQAAIATCHTAAPSTQETDGERVVLLHEALGRVAPSPVVELNPAVAVAMANGPRQALHMVDELAASGRLSGSHLLPGVRGELLTRLGRTTETRAELELAARPGRNTRERSVLLRKAAALP
ncbi:DUF6596 domain-containing protein [Kitasatospora sp. NPDC088264]|uniref:RNA polymerase sigma factor n=1 Tax=Kitasatospora sp. NPDC088264 TaxID=3155296 RepID=UPI003412ABBE